jgi:hypothetical protein
MVNRILLICILIICNGFVFAQCDQKLKECMSIVNDCEYLINDYKKMISLKDIEISNLSKQSENYSDMYKYCEITLDVERAEFNYIVKKERRNKKMWQIIGIIAGSTALGTLTYAILK